MPFGAKHPWWGRRRGAAAVEDMKDDDDSRTRAKSLRQAHTQGSRASTATDRLLSNRCRSAVQFTVGRRSSCQRSTFQRCASRVQAAVAPQRWGGGGRRRRPSSSHLQCYGQQLPCPERRRPPRPWRQHQLPSRCIHRPACCRAPDFCCLLAHTCRRLLPRAHRVSRCGMYVQWPSASVCVCMCVWRRGEGTGPTRRTFGWSGPAASSSLGGAAGYLAGKTNSSSYKAATGASCPTLPGSPCSRSLRSAAPPNQLLALDSLQTCLRFMFSSWLLPLSVSTIGC